MDFHVVETSCGKIRGLVQDEVYNFRGIPYAASPIGAGRFKPPGPRQPWTGIRDTLSFGARSLQYENAFPVHPEVRPLLTGYMPETMSEDCLFLNIWTLTLQPGQKAPVMVWLHGGAFTSGCGAQPWTNGASLSRQGVVVVTLNHRLGALGYLHLADIAGPEFIGSSMAGMLDIIAALRWVKENISAFGGDPSNVTIFGQSGGGAKVSVLMAMPDAVGLFHKAIIQSGPAVQMASSDDGSATALEVLKELGLDPSRAYKLQVLPAETLLQAQISLLRKASLASFAERRRRGFNPVLGQRELPAGPFEPQAPAISDHVPLMIGSTKDEMTIFYAMEPWFDRLNDQSLRDRVRLLAGERADAIIATYRRARPEQPASDLLIAISGDQGIRVPSLLIADRKVMRAAAPTFVYSFDAETPVLRGRLKSPHTLEVPYVFDQLRQAPIAGNASKASLALARTMSETWVAFARTGTPNNPTIPNWPAYAVECRPTMIFDHSCRIENDPCRTERLAWS